jgi:hypothetical protein
MTLLKAKQVQGPSLRPYFDGLSFLFGPFTDVLGNPLPLGDPSYTVVFYIWATTGQTLGLGQQSQLFNSNTAANSIITPHNDGTIDVFLQADDIAPLPANTPLFYQISVADGTNSEGLCWGELEFPQ